MIYPVIADSDYALDWPFEIRCPVCNSAWTHHGPTTVFDRLNGEDGESVTLRPGDPLIRPAAFNPSPRRDAVMIAFEGECGHRWNLAILQHKGNTFLQVLPPDDIPGQVAGDSHD